jgi:hypothetical protein
MAFLPDRILYRLSAVWWSAIYGGLSRSSDQNSAPARTIGRIELAPAEAEIPVAA